MSALKIDEYKVNPTEVFAGQVFRAGKKLKLYRAVKVNAMVKSSDDNRCIGCAGYLRNLCVKLPNCYPSGCYLRFELIGD